MIFNFIKEVPHNPSIPPELALRDSFSWDVSPVRSITRKSGTPIPDDSFLHATARPPQPAVSACVTAWIAVRRSPSFVWRDIKSAPLVSAGILAGLGAASCAGIMDTIAPWVFAGGTATAAWMTVKGGLNIRREAPRGLSDSLEKASWDFGMGIFSFGTMAAASALLYGLNRYGVIPETDTGGQFDGAVRALASLLHSSDEIAMGTIAARKLLGWGGGRNNDEA